MSMTLRMCTVAFALAAAACGAPLTLRPPAGADRATVERDRYECYREASMVPRVAPPGAPPAASGGWGGAFERGYYQSQAAGAAAASEDRAIRLLVLCLTNRGWSIAR